MDSPVSVPNGSNWSKLPLDLLALVFERLGFADFERAKSVCPSWRSASGQSLPNGLIPWLILFPEKGTDYCLLYNSEETEKSYVIRDLVVHFAKNHVLATCGSWLFLRDPRYNLYILNIFTRERIDLPPVEAQLGTLKFERTIEDVFLVSEEDNTFDVKDINTFDVKDINIKSSIFWIDEKTKDYVVMWNYRGLVYSRKGDNAWKQANVYRIVDMVYKDDKLYVYTGYSRGIKILDFSEDIPQLIFETQVKDDYLWSRGLPRRIFPHLGDVWDIKNQHLVITVAGDILIVNSKIRSNSDVWSFKIEKLDSTNSEWEELTSLGDEAILLDLGLTVPANTIKGVHRNSVYFSGVHCFRCDHVWSEKDILIYNLDTHKTERPHRSTCSFIQSSVARWFVPNFNWK